MSWAAFHNRELDPALSGRLISPNDDRVRGTGGAEGWDLDIRLRLRSNWKADLQSLNIVYYEPIEAIQK